MRLYIEARQDLEAVLKIVPGGGSKRKIKEVLHEVDPDNFEAPRALEPRKPYGSSANKKDPKAKDKKEENQPGQPEPDLKVMIAELLEEQAALRREIAGLRELLKAFYACLPLIEEVGMERAVVAIKTILNLLRGSRATDEI